MVPGGHWVASTLGRNPPTSLYHNNSSRRSSIAELFSSGVFHTLHLVLPVFSGGSGSLIQKISPTYLVVQVLPLPNTFTVQVVLSVSSIIVKLIVCSILYGYVFQTLIFVANMGEHAIFSGKRQQKRLNEK
jgi:hypothetical protein